MKIRYPRAKMTALLLLAIVPAAAQAHLYASGLGPIYDGIFHFVLSPEDLLPVVTFAFFAGLRGARYSRSLAGLIPLGWCAGGLLARATLVTPSADLSAATAALFLLVGGLLAANVNLSLASCIAIGGLIGLLRGMAQFADASGESGYLLTLLGTCATLFVVFSIATSITLPLKRLWMIMAARVWGSWLAALGLLMAGWIWRYNAVM